MLKSILTDSAILFAGYVLAAEALEQLRGSRIKERALVMLSSGEDAAEFWQGDQ